MSTRINIRLPDELYADLKDYAEKNGVTITDVIISGISNEMASDKPERPVVPKGDIPVALKAAIEKKVSSGGFFHPMPKVGKK